MQWFEISGITRKGAALLAILSVSLFSCTTEKAPDTAYQNSIGRVVIMAGNANPELVLEGMTHSKSEGAWETMGDAFEASAQGDELGILLLPITLPVAAAVGALSSPSAETVTRAERHWASHVKRYPLSLAVRDQVVALALDHGADLQLLPPERLQNLEQSGNYAALTTVDINTALVITVTRVSAFGTELDAPLRLHISAQARLLRLPEQTEIAVSQAEYYGRRYTLPEWTNDYSGKLVQALSVASEAIGRHLYESLFMLYPFPDQSWHSSFPRGTLGLAPLAPSLDGFTIAPMSTSRPTLHWEPFPRASDLAASSAVMRRVKNVRYDLFIAQVHDGLAAIVYQREGIPVPEHTLDQSLRAGTEYSWSVRARFELDNRERVTEWSQPVPTFRRMLVPPQGHFYPLKIAR